MRDVKKIIVHASYTTPAMDIGAKEIDQWHKEKGWNGIGYHFVIRRDGTQEEGRHISKPGAHTRGHNKTSIGICIVGGKAIDGGWEANYTEVQCLSLSQLVDHLLDVYELTNDDVLLHNQADTGRECPGVRSYGELIGRVCHGGW